MGEGNPSWTVGELRLILGAILLLFVASLLHSWYSGNAAVRITQQALGFMMFGSYVLAFSVLLLLCGLALLWSAAGFVGAIIGAAVYFLVLPLIIIPLLTALDLIPRRDA